MDSPLFLYTLHLADNSLILGQRNSEWTAHGPVLEQDIAITNISLDLIGQSRNFYQYACRIYSQLNASEKKRADKFLPRAWKNFKRELNEDDLAFLRDENQYLNLLITELPKGDWAITVLRQFFFSAFQYYLYQDLIKITDEMISAIAEKSLKEVEYHLRWSSEWVIRLGDGTEESEKRMKNAIHELWPFTGEFFTPTDYEEALGPSFSLEERWIKKVNEIMCQAKLHLPEKESWNQNGGKNGRHTEHMGYILTEMQFIQRAYPNLVW